MSRQRGWVSVVICAVLSFGVACSTGPDEIDDDRIEAADKCDDNEACDEEATRDPASYFDLNRAPDRYLTVPVGGRLVFSARGVRRVLIDSEEGEDRRLKVETSQSGQYMYVYGIRPGDRLLHILSTNDAQVTMSIKIIHENEPDDEFTIQVGETFTLDMQGVRSVTDAPSTRSDGRIVRIVPDGDQIVVEGEQVGETTIGLFFADDDTGSLIRVRVQ